MRVTRACQPGQQLTPSPGLALTQPCPLQELQRHTSTWAYSLRLSCSFSVISIKKALTKLPILCLKNFTRTDKISVNVLWLSQLNEQQQLDCENAEIKQKTKNLSRKCFLDKMFQLVFIERIHYHLDILYKACDQERSMKDYFYPLKVVLLL